MRTRHRYEDLQAPFLGTHAVGAGVITKGQLRGPRYRRLFPDVYLPAGSRITHAVKCAAAALAVPDTAVLTGRSAAAVFGTDLVRPTDPVEWLIEENSRFGPIRGMAVKRTPLRAADWRHGGAYRIATPSRLGFDLAKGADLRKSVSYLDAALRAGLLDRAALHQYCRGRHEHGVRNVRAALELADERAESLPESELRVVLLRGGIAVRPQVNISDEQGLFIARADLAVDGYRVAIQYDGAWHALREQLERDREQRRRLREAGWEVVHVTAKDLAGDLAALCETVRRARRRSRRR